MLVDRRKAERSAGRSCSWPVAAIEATIGLDQQVLTGPRDHRAGAPKPVAEA